MAIVTPDHEKIASLVHQTLVGDTFAFEQLVRLHIRTATAIALAITGRMEDAEDVAQNAFILAHKKLHTCKDARRFSGWLCQIVKNQSLSWVSKRSKRDRHIDSAFDCCSDLATESMETATIERQLIMRALSKLDVTQRQIVMLHALEGWTHEEIADYLAIRPESSRWHLFNARKIMKLDLANIFIAERRANNE